LKFVKTKLDTKNDKKAVFEHRGQFYLYSFVNNEDMHVNETMVFPCDKDGEVRDYAEVAVDSGYVASAVMMENLRRRLDSMVDTNSE